MLENGWTYLILGNTKQSVDHYTLLPKLAGLAQGARMSRSKLATVVFLGVGLAIGGFDHELFWRLPVQFLGESINIGF